MTDPSIHRQIPTISLDQITTNPRRGEHAEDTGSYELAIKALNPVLDPSEWLEIELFITGYGEITGAKIVAYPSSYLFDDHQSKIWGGFGPSQSGRHRFGAMTMPFDTNGVTLQISGRQGAPGASLFFDLTDGRVPQILTETKQDEAPYRFLLKTLPTIRPGKYSVDFFMTYHDGQKWRTSSKKADFQVRNFLERFAVQIGLLALAASLISLLKTTGALQFLGV